MKDHPNIARIGDEWRAGTSPLCEGTKTYGEETPTRDHFSLYLLRDGTVGAYACDMELYTRYEVTYGRHTPTSRWCYEPPAHAVVRS